MWPLLRRRRARLSDCDSWDRLLSRFDWSVAGLLRFVKVVGVLLLFSYRRLCHLLAGLRFVPDMCHSVVRACGLVNLVYLGHILGICFVGFRALADIATALYRCDDRRQRFPKPRSIGGEL